MESLCILRSFGACVVFWDFELRSRGFLHVDRGVGHWERVDGSKFRNRRDLAREIARDRALGTLRDDGEKVLRRS